jgi:hypothetical protein
MPKLEAVERENRETSAHFRRLRDLALGVGGFGPTS